MNLDAWNLGTVGEVGGEPAWSGRRLREEGLRRAALLLERGVKRRERVVIAHGGSPSFFADLLAVWHVGACAACANPGLTPRELENICSFLEAKLVIVERELPCDPGVPVIRAGAEASGTGAPETAGDLDDPALILFTSGTTGEPKGVVHTFRSILARVSLNRNHIGDAILARTLCVLPTHFGHGLIGNCLTPLLHGHELRLLPGVGVANAARLGSVIDEQGITFLSSVPAVWKLVLRVGSAPEKGTLGQVGVGSAPLSAELWNEVIDWTGTRNVVNMYGITEAANWISGASGAEYEPRDGLIGRPWGGAFAVRNESGRVSRVGEGELLVLSPSLMSGYFGRPDLTGEVLEGGWFATGDVGRVEADGTAGLTGRIKHEINRAGIKIHPEDLDLLLESRPDVLEACAFGIPDAAAGEIVGIAIRLAPGGKTDITDLRTWCAEQIRSEAVPERWFPVEEIPKTDRGKVKREVVREFCLGAGM